MKFRVRDFCLGNQEVKGLRGFCALKSLGLRLYVGLRGLGPGLTFWDAKLLRVGKAWSLLGKKFVNIQTSALRLLSITTIEFALTVVVVLLMGKLKRSSMITIAD